MTPHESVPSGVVEELVTALPKVELHVHLEGSMPPALLLELADKHNLTGLPDTLGAIREWYEFTDFEHFGTVYNTAITALRDEEDFALLTERVAAGLAAHRVRYAEVILTPYSHISRGVPAEAVFGGIERGRLAALQTHGIELRWLPDFEGHRGVAAGEATLDSLLAADLDSVVGFNVGGLEVDRDPFTELFTRAREAGLRSVPHAGEVGGPDRIWSAVHRLQADRIGHGIACLADPALVEHLVATQTPLDVCPTSNVRTRAVPSLAEHPLPRMIDAGLMVTLNTDDPAMFDTDLTNEYRVAAGLGLTPDTLVDLARNAVIASYAPRPLKDELLVEIDRISTAQP